MTKTATLPRSHFSDCPHVANFEQSEGYVLLEGQHSVFGCRVCPACFNRMVDELRKLEPVKR